MSIEHILAGGFTKRPSRSGIESIDRWDERAGGDMLSLFILGRGVRKFDLFPAPEKPRGLKRVWQ